MSGGDGEGRICSPSPIPGALWLVGSSSRESAEPQGTTTSSPSSDGMREAESGFFEMSPMIMNTTAPLPTPAPSTASPPQAPPPTSASPPLTLSAEPPQPAIRPPLPPTLTPPAPREDTPVPSPKAGSRSKSAGRGEQGTAKSGTRSKTPKKRRGMSVGEMASARLAMSHTARSYNAEREQLVARHDAEVKGLKKRHAEEVKALRGEIDRIHAEFVARRGSEVGELQGLLQRSTDDLAVSQEATHELLRRLHAAHERIDRLERVREEDRGQWLATVENWKQHLETSEAEARREREKLEAQLEDHVRCMADLTERNATLVANEAKWKDELTKATQQMEVLRERNVDLLECADSAKRGYNDLISALGKEKERVAALEHTVSSLRSDILRLQTEKSDAERERKRVELEHEQALAIRRQQEGKLARLEGALTVLQQRDAELQDELRHSAERSREATQELDKAAIRIQQLESTSDHTEITLHSTQRQLKRALADVDRLRRDIHLKDAQVDELQAKLMQHHLDRQRSAVPPRSSRSPSPTLLSPAARVRRNAPSSMSISSF
eukprot:Sspe_Gene.98230::Locus_71677_Transcript_1_1_Confidence_1.000_Length_1704::g.98230::m.98230